VLDPLLVILKYCYIDLIKRYCRVQFFTGEPKFHCNTPFTPLNNSSKSPVTMAALWDDISNLHWYDLFVLYCSSFGGKN
jgi:hypothetical protein